MGVCVRPTFPRVLRKGVPHLIQYRGLKKKRARHPIQRPTPMARLGVSQTNGIAKVAVPDSWDGDLMMPDQWDC